MNPVEINGAWDKGYVLDEHTVRSVHIGTYSNGRPKFDTEYTELGELVFKLKNRNMMRNAQRIIEYISDFLDEWDIGSKIDGIIPVPPSNKNRLYQPAFEIAKCLGVYLEKPVSTSYLVNNNEKQAKDKNVDLNGKIEMVKPFKYKNNILVVDDLYSSGDTIKETVRVLRSDPNLNKIYIVVMTRTRR